MESPRDPDTSPTQLSASDEVLIDATFIAAWPLPPLDPDADKNERGHVLLIAGCREMPGAVMLAAEAALRAGAGKVTIATSAAIADSIAIAMPETRVIALRELRGGGLRLERDAIADCIDKIDVALIGPGMQDAHATQTLAQRWVEWQPDAPLILDACALDAIDALPASAQPRLITPHCGEMAHLLARVDERASKEEIAAQAAHFALRAAQRWQCVTTLKGSTTVIATPSGRRYRHTGGNGGLAMSGSGDCLAGLIAGLAARGATLEQAAVWGTFIHGRAGEELAQQQGDVGYLAREIPPQIPRLVQTHSQQL